MSGTIMPFGKGREGSIESLKKMGERYDFLVGIIEPVKVGQTVVSSSAVRELLSNGRVEEASKLLGRSYVIEGEVVHGAHRGQTLGLSHSESEDSKRNDTGLRRLCRGCPG